MMDVLTKEFAVAFPGSDLTSPLEPEYYDDEDEKESIIDATASVRDSLTELHRQLLLRLEPLRRVQRNLEKTLGAASTEEVHSGTGSVAPWAAPKFRSREFAVTSRSGWKSALNRVRGIKSDGSSAYNEKVAVGQVRFRSLCYQTYSTCWPATTSIVCVPHVRGEERHVRGRAGRRTCVRGHRGLRRRHVRALDGPRRQGGARSERHAPGRGAGIVSFLPLRFG